MVRWSKKVNLIRTENCSLKSVNSNDYKNNYYDYLWCYHVSDLIWKCSKVNWNAETSWPLSQDFETLKTVPRNFWKIRFRFRDMGRWNLRFYWFRRFSRKDGKICVRYRESHAKEPWRQARSLGSLHVRFINDNELCSVPDDHRNSSNLTWIWFNWIGTVLRKIYLLWWNQHTCCECGAKWCASLYVWANRCHHDGSDSYVDKDSTND